MKIKNGAVSKLAQSLCVYYEILIFFKRLISDEFSGISDSQGVKIREQA